MGKWNLGQVISVDSHPMVIIRKKIAQEKQLQTRVNAALEQKKKNQLEQQKATRQKNAGGGGKKSRKTAANKKTLAEIEKMKGMNIGKQNALLLGELEKHILKKGETSEDLEDATTQGNLTAKKLRKIQDREIDGIGEQESEDVDSALQQLLSSLAPQEIEEEEGEEYECISDEEAIEDAEGDEESALMETKLRALLRESKNDAKVKKDKKEYLHRHKLEQDKRVEKSLQQLRADQNKLLRQISSLTTAQNSRKRKNHYNVSEESGGESEEADEDQVDHLKRSKPQKQQVSASTTSSCKAKKKKPVEKDNDSETQLMRYLQSLQK